LVDEDACRQAMDVCACYNFRKASRAVTQFFDETLAPVGLRSTQLVILLNVAASQPPAKSDEPPATVIHLAREMVMDRSTLARNLKPLEKRQFIKITPGTDRRTRVVRLTARGQKVLAEAVPLWEQAQRRFVEQVGAKRWQSTLKNLRSAVTATSRA
jgi:DNA-binding MarR family transcriptional regulator